MTQEELALIEAEERGRSEERARWQQAVRAWSQEADIELAAISDTDRGKRAAWYGRKHGAWAVEQRVLPSAQAEQMERDASNRCNGEVVAARHQLSRL